MIEETYREEIESFVPSANEADHHFPLQNLPFGVMRGKGVVVRIGDEVLLCGAAVSSAALAFNDSELSQALLADNLLPLMRLKKEQRLELRRVLFSALRADNQPFRKRCGEMALLVAANDEAMTLPHPIPNYTDFYASIDHARNVGKLFRPENPLLPNYLWNPIAYHGRASSVVISGHPLVRPNGQRRDGEGAVFGPTTQLDYEVELGIFVAEGNSIGSPVPITDAEDKIFGFCILNDWSARDIQLWESQPLGPFLGKNFLTTISPWIVTAEALEPFRVPARTKEGGEPAALPYLSSTENLQRGGVDVCFDVFLRTAEMKQAGQDPVRLSTTYARRLFWTPAQMIVQHTANGCNLCPGDLIGSGTVSGAGGDEKGCLLELTERGKRELKFVEPRTFLEDGDEVMMSGWCRRDGYRSIGFGECRGQVVEPA